MDRRTVGAVLAVVVGLAAVLGVACGQPTDPAPLPNVIVNAGGNGNPTIIIGNPSPSPGTAPAGCSVVASNGVSASLNGSNVTSWRIGDTPRLDTTPKDASGVPVPAQCHGSVVTWTLSGSAPCSLQGDTSGFTPFVKCTAAGQITISASVSAPGSTGSASFTVTQ
jgi:hypothetical protein